MNEELRNKDLKEQKESKEPKEYKILKPGDWCDSGCVEKVWVDGDSVHYLIRPVGRIDIKDEDIIRPTKKPNKDHKPSEDHKKEKSSWCCF